MKLVVLTDNRVNDELLESEHGLSIYLETEQSRYLLDTGRTDKLIRNAERLHVNLQSVDYVFLSHAHADHTGGLEAFLRINEKARIILSPVVMQQRCFSSRQGNLRENGIPVDLTPWLDRCLFVNDELVLDDGTCFFTCKTDRFPQPKANAVLWAGQPDFTLPDSFEHELAACFGTSYPLLYVGCSHKGVLNILTDYHKRYDKDPTYVLGGFHLLDSQLGVSYESLEDIKQLAKWLAAYYPETQFITGHCTGDLVFDHMKQVLSRQLQQFYTGLILRTAE